MTRINRRRLLGLVAAAWAAVFFCGAGLRVLADCASFGLPFMDLGSEPGFCAAIAEAYYTGITNGTSPSTFSPDANVTRLQAAALVTRTLDAGLTRGSRRAALGQWWTTTPHWDQGLGVTDVGALPQRVVSDGEDVWVTNYGDSSVSRVHASDGRALGSWTGATHAFGILSVFGRIFVTSLDAGKIFMIDPSKDPGEVNTVVSGIPGVLTSITTDGSRLFALGGTTVWIVNPSDWSVTAGPTSDAPSGLAFDGKNLWLTESSGGHLLEFDASLTNVLVEVPVPGLGALGADPLFDGTNIWVLGYSDNSITIVRARDGAVLRRISAADGVLLDHPYLAAFDGQRVVVTNNGFLAVFRSTDFSFVSSVSSSGFQAVCSDGIDFWLTIGPSSVGRL